MGNKKITWGVIFNYNLPEPTPEEIKKYKDRKMYALALKKKMEKEFMPRQTI